MKRLIAILMMLIFVFCAFGCDNQKKETQNSELEQGQLSTEQCYYEAEKLARAMNGEDLYEDESTDVKGSTYTGITEIQGQSCRTFRVTMGDGSKKQFAVDDQNNWYFLQDGVYVPITISANGSLTIGKKSDQNNPGSPSGTDQTNAKSETQLEQIVNVLVQDKWTSKKANNGQLNGQNCDFYDILVENNVVAQVANAAGENNAWYFRNIKEGDFFRKVILTDSEAWLEKPVDTQETTIAWVAKQFLHSESVAVVDSVITMNGVNCTLFRLEVDGKVVAHMAVSVDGEWYYGDESAISFSLINWTKTGPEIKNGSNKDE